MKNLYCRGMHAAGEAKFLSRNKAAQQDQHPDSVIIIDITGA